MKEYYIGRCSTVKTVSEIGSIPMKLGPFLYYINGYPDRGVSKGVDFSFLKIYFQMEDNCFTILCWFLLYINMNLP